ncbi:hypothetical protein [Microbacterium sp.]|uniref:hypothetical protein n=1 Tax=Microbacterium sp. TaxID=51671 RepID=UPI003A86EFD0
MSQLPPGASPPPAPQAPYDYPRAAPPTVPPVYAQPSRPQGSTVLGVVALLIAIIAVVGATITAGVNTISIAPEVGAAIWGASGPDPRLLSPVKAQAVMVEASFWIGTALGIWAIVQGAIAIRTRRGGAFGTAAIVVAALGPVLFLTTVVLVLLLAG